MRADKAKKKFMLGIHYTEMFHSAGGAGPSPSSAQLQGSAVKRTPRPGGLSQRRIGSLRTSGGANAGREPISTAPTGRPGAFARLIPAENGEVTDGDELNTAKHDNANKLASFTSAAVLLPVQGDQQLYVPALPGIKQHQCCESPGFSGMPGSSRI